MKSPPKTSNANFKNAKLLLIEDSDDQWLIIQRTLQQSFSEVMVQRVATIQQALTLLEEWQGQEWEIPKLILMDLYLPANTDGWQLLRQIKMMAAPMRRIPIVMLTSSASAVDIEQAYELGISAYLVKPLDFAGWQTCFEELRTYWWETATLPPVQYGS